MEVRYHSASGRSYVWNYGQIMFEGTERECHDYIDKYLDQYRSE